MSEIPAALTYALKMSKKIKGIIKMAPKVESYSFGNITIDGTSYRNDVIICPDGIRDNWWRKQGHSLHPEDIRGVLDDINPDTLIVGRGANGALTVPDETRRWIESRGTQVLDLPTREAVEKYNKMSQAGDVVAALHLTC